MISNCIDPLAFGFQLSYHVIISVYWVLFAKRAPCMGIHVSWYMNSFPHFWINWTGYFTTRCMFSHSPSWVRCSQRCVFAAMRGGSTLFYHFYAAFVQLYPFSWLNCSVCFYLDSFYPEAFVLCSTWALFLFCFFSAYRYIFRRCVFGMFVPNTHGYYSP